ncbi:MAG: YidC/Oxa1 family membrane protein insertase [Oscillospiraceae bacterium]|jgi:YidC/Oxa1 family membrane protein insertase|nr:YidC/Oxa1 family membrane protein insertase [Oscillospiraceae bacterium]
MLPGLDLLAVPLGYILSLIYRFIGNYFVSIFLFTLVVRAATFPLSLKSQKMQADRARLAPRLERLQKKYAKDRKKLQEKQMALYEKEGVSLTGGCLPMLVQMVVLFGIIAVIYSPLTHLSRIPAPVINASLEAVAQPTKTDENNKTVDVSQSNKLSKSDRSGVYKELNLLMVIEPNKKDILAQINELSDDVRKNITGEEYYEKMLHLSKDFNFFGKTLLERPNKNGFKNISILWLIPLLSGLTAFGSSLVSMKFMNAAQGDQSQPGQGCQSNMMLFIMPLFSLYITFTVPGGVGVYWICSNLIAVGQTIILNRIYNIAEIRAQAEIEYEERRKRKLEDKKRLAQARARENAEWNAANNSDKKASSKNSNKKQREDKGEDNQTQE